jgi:hypothetical protein
LPVYGNGETLAKAGVQVYGFDLTDQRGRPQGDRMLNQELVAWLLAGDVSIQYQTQRDLLGHDRPDLQRRIATEGLGAAYLNCRNPDGSWGRAFYQPKWTSTHYTLLDLKTLEIAPDQPLIQATLRQAGQWKGPDGGVNPSRTVKHSDVCINGMFLNYACYFGAPSELLVSVVDYVLGEQMADGGFNCQRTRSLARVTVRCIRRSPCWRAFWNTRAGATPIAPTELEQVAAASDASSSCCTASTNPTTRARSFTGISSTSPFRRAGSTTSCVRSTISGRPAHPGMNAWPMPVMCC